MGETPPPKRIFLSHTTDLRSIPARRSYVVAAEAAVVKTGHLVADMAYLPAADRPPANVCRDAVRAAHALVLIAGFRYGTALPDRPDVSHTEWEFLAAEQAHIPRYVFMLDDDADGAGELRGDTADAARQRAFRDRLLGRSDITVAMVDSPGTLEAKLIHTLNVEFPHPPGEVTGRGTTNTMMHNSIGQIGDHNTMVNHFPSPPRKRRWFFR